MRLIDANELKERIKRFLGIKSLDYLQPAEKAIVKLIDGMATVKEVDWIPCREGLPEKSGEYFVTWTAPRLKGRRFIEIVEFTAPHSTYDEDGYTIVPGPDDEGEWETYDINYDGVEVLAWMVLPNLYTGE